MSHRIGNVIIVVALIVCAAILIMTSIADTAEADELAGMVISLCKLTPLVVGGGFAIACTRGFERGTVIRRGWAVVAVWLCAWAAAQAVYCYYALALHRSAPVPSIADPLFLVGQLASLYGLFTFVTAFRASGLVPEARSRTALFVVATLGVIVASAMLGMGMRAVMPVLDSVIIGSYPVLDCLALWPIVLLLRITRGMGEGRVALVWRHTLFGILACSIGDVAFAVFTHFDVSLLDPLIDFAFCAAYVGIAAGALQQHSIASS